MILQDTLWFLRVPQSYFRGPQDFQYSFECLWVFQGSLLLPGCPQGSLGFFRAPKGSLVIEFRSIVGLSSAQSCFAMMKVRFSDTMHIQKLIDTPASRGRPLKKDISTNWHTIGKTNIQFKISRVPNFTTRQRSPKSKLKMYFSILSGASIWGINGVMK